MKKEKMEETDGEKRCRNNEVDTTREGKIDGDGRSDQEKRR